MSDVSSAVDNWLRGDGERLRDRPDADACYAEVRRRFWIAEARDVLVAEGINDPSEALVDLVAEEMWSESVSDLEGNS
jgi:hypothetical protein